MAARRHLLTPDALAWRTFNPSSCGFKHEFEKRL